MASSPTNTWDATLERVRHKVSRQSFATWFQGTRLVREDASCLTVAVPNRWFADWLKTHYQPLVDEALREIQRPGLDVNFMAESEAGAASAPPPPSSQGSAIHAAGRSNPGTAGQAAALRLVQADERPTRLNPKYTFGSFVVSSCNEFAHAASRAVADGPACTYNPLYLYGGVGLGKTHLMQAIGNHVAGTGRSRLRYVSSETFISDLINAIRTEKTLEFKNSYRNVDILLIDDIQFLAGKERTQEEFFHTFNALYDQQKQIVITSDVPPREIPTLEERLRSRFEWGLIADIQPPDLETKVAILRKKTEAAGVRVPDDVGLLIASHCGSNVRELEGALTKIVAYARMSDREITVDLASDQLGRLTTRERPTLTVDEIKRMVAQRFGLRPSDLTSRSNSPTIARPRQIAMFLCKRLTPSSLPDIGRRFGKHHTTVLHAVRKIDALRSADPQLDVLIDELVDSLNRRPPSTAPVHGA